MLFLGDLGANVDILLAEVGSRAQGLATHLPLPDQTFTLPPRQRLFTTTGRNRFFRVRSGLLYVEIEQRVTHVLQDGDFAGIDLPQGDPLPDCFCEDPTLLDTYDRETWQEHLRNNAELSAAWNAYLLSLVALFSRALGQIIKDHHRPQAGFLRFRPGETILSKGDEPDYVYTLMKGGARVEIDGIEVGLVAEGEIFGALAALTGTTRGASVVASVQCTVMAVPKEQFSAMIQAHPETCLHLMQSMARTIDDLNSRCLTLQKSP